MEQQAFTIPELMAIYKIGRTKLYDEIAAGRLKCYKIGRATRASRTAAEEWQRGLEQMAKKEEAQAVQ